MDTDLVHSRGMPAESALEPTPEGSPEPEGDVTPENVPDAPVPDDPGTGGPDDDDDDA